MPLKPVCQMRITTSAPQNPMQMPHQRRHPTCSCKTKLESIVTKIGLINIMVVQVGKGSAAMPTLNKPVVAISNIERKLCKPGERVCTNVEKFRPHINSAQMVAKKNRPHVTSTNEYVCSANFIVASSEIKHPIVANIHKMPAVRFSPLICILSV